MGLFAVSGNHQYLKDIAIVVFYSWMVVLFTRKSARSKSLKVKITTRIMICSEILLFNQ